MPLVISPQPWLTLLDDNGAPVPNGQLALYEAGTSTPVTVYTDSLAAVPHPWPITLDGTGRIPGGLYLLPEVAYKFVLHEPKLATLDLTGAIIKTQDNVMGHGGKVNVSGSVPDAGQLPDTGEPGDAFISADDGHLWVWDDINGIWVDVGPVQGPPGQTGPMGPKGDTGATGPQGATGATGAPGPQGIQGVPGAPGAAGTPGKDGKDGAPGAPGPQGPQGATGPQGPGGEGQIGPQGPKGDPGPVGPSGPPGAKGDTGATGAQGPAGIIGPHAPTHAVGGSDPLAVTALAGYPGNATTFLRGDGTFAAPPGGTTPALHAATHRTGGTDPLALDAAQITTGQFVDARLSANVALRNVANNFSASQYIIAPSAHLLLQDTAGAANQRLTRLIQAGNTVLLQTLDDAQATEQGRLQMDRVGNVALSGTLTATGISTTPVPAANIVGPIPDAKLTVNVLKYAGGYPGGTVNYLRADGNFAVPPSGRVVGALNTGGIQNAVNVTGLDVLNYGGTGTVTINGLAGGVDGQQLVIRNLTGELILLRHQSASASAGNKLFNVVSTGFTPINGASGYARYVYGNGTWWLAGHEQGVPYTEPFFNGNYRGLNDSFTWTVEAGDVLSENWYLQGALCTYNFYILNTSIGGAVGTTLTRQIPVVLGWTQLGGNGIALITNIGVAGQFYGTANTGNGGRVSFLRFDNLAWPNVNNAIGLIGQHQFLLQ